MRYNIYFQDLSPEMQSEIVDDLKRALRDEIDEAKEASPSVNRELLAAEIVDDYINCHNFANEFEI